jgi:hypothetical protein
LGGKREERKEEEVKVREGSLDEWREEIGCEQSYFPPGLTILFPS